MSDDIEIRPYIPGDEEGIVELLKLSFPHWAKRDNALETWRWQHADALEKGEIAVALITKKIVGIHQSAYIDLKLGPTVIPAFYGADTAVHPDYRKFGIYTKLVKLKTQMCYENNILFHYGSSSSPAVIKDWKKREGIELFPHLINVMVRIKDIKQHLTMRPRKSPTVIQAGFTLLKVLNAARNSLTPAPKHVNVFTIEDVSRFDDRIDVFWDKIKDDYDFIIERKSLYMNRNFCDFPTIKYRVRHAVKDGEVLGYIIMELRKDDQYVEGYIIDMLTLQGRRDVSDALFKDACNYFDALGVNTVYYRVVKGHPDQEASSRCGFLNTQLNIFTVNCQVMAMEKEYMAITSSLPDKFHFSYLESL